MQDDKEFLEDSSVDTQQEIPNTSSQGTSSQEGLAEMDSLLNLSSSSYSLVRETIKISEVGLSEPLKIGRSSTRIGLTKTIQELGVLSPIHVMTVESDEDDDDDDFKYVLIEGLRRLYGAVKAGKTEIEAVIWDFKDKELGRKIALPLGLVINRSEKRQWNEVWELYKILELQFSITPNSLEYLLQLESGDAMKLKDCMLCTYTEVQEELLSGKKSLEQCYKLLQKLRKEENRLAMEENIGLSDNIEDAQEVTSAKEERQEVLSDDEVNEILELGDSVSNSDLDSMSFEDLDRSEEVRGVEHQKVGERHIVDPEIKQATFRRDNFKCQCCGVGGEAFLGTLIYHHKVPVSDGGADTVKNGLTLCDSCHITLHLFQQGKIVLTKELFESYEEKEQKRLKLIMKYANIAIEADKLRGKKREDVRKENKIQHRMPGDGLKDIQQNYSESKSK
jgi:5-methylcytosine-specific restriction protein A